MPNLVSHVNNPVSIQLSSSSSSLQRKATEATSSSGPDNRIQGSHGSIVRLSVSAFVPIYFTLGWPHLEYTLQACSPNLVSGADCLEQTQRLATRLVKGFRRLSYEERLRWHSLRWRRPRIQSVFFCTPAPFLSCQCGQA